MRGTEIFLRPIGSPLPLGMLGLTVASAMLSAFNLGWIPIGEQHDLAIALIAFGFPLQAVSMIFGFLARDAVVASGFGVQSAAWLTIGLLLLVSPPGSRNQALAFLLFVASAALVSAVVVAAQAKLVPALVMSLTVVRWCLTGLYEHLGSKAILRAGGWEGLLLAALAVYTAVAADIESEQHRTLLPLGRFGRGRAAARGGPTAQTDHIENEPGVRAQL